MSEELVSRYDGGLQGLPGYYGIVILSTALI
jgi:hypothetical protein